MQPMSDKPEEVKKVSAAEPSRNEPTAQVAPPPQNDQGAAARASNGARELDAGKSTQVGNTDYFDGPSRVTDADTVVELGQILANRGKADVTIDSMAQELRNRGYQVETTTVDGKKAIRFQNGDVFIDTSGDGQLGTQDVNFQKALSAVEQKHGVNLSELKGVLNVLDQKRKLEQALKKMGAGGLGMASLLGANGPEAGDLASIKEVLAATDKDMRWAGYDKSTSAFELWQQSALTPELSNLGLSWPGIPTAEELSYRQSLQESAGLFDLAYEVAGLVGTRGRQYGQ